jgi:hypothetical protein
MPEEKKTLKANLSKEIANGVYSNIFNVIFSQAEFVLDFGKLVPGKDDFDIVARVLMAPMNLKRMINVLEENLKKYENQFGEIKVSSRDNDVKLGF